MISISVSDLQLISELSTLSEFDIVNPDNDEKVAKYLYAIGMDCYDYPYCFVPNRHRNLQGQDIVGFRAIGEIRCDVEYRNSYLAGITERLIISSYTDPSCTEEIAELAFKTRNWEEYLNDNDSLDWDESRAIFPLDQLEENWEEAEATIKELEDVLYSIRGSCYNSSGSLKMMHEYKKGCDD